MHILTDEYIRKCLATLLCSYDQHNYSRILYDPEFRPESFTLEDKRRGGTSIFFPGIGYRDWIMNMVREEVSKIEALSLSRLELEVGAFENFENLVDFEINGLSVGAQLYNQEIIDVIRRVISFTLYGDAGFELHTAQKFNALADDIIPTALEIISQKNFSLHDLLALSIVSGLSGLDLKGAPAAASSYANIGIPMALFSVLEAKAVAEIYVNSLLDIFHKCTYPLFEWNLFIAQLKKSKRLVWLTDDYIESHFDLFFIEKILDSFSIDIELIPKNGRHGNDLSGTDLETLLRNPTFKNLLCYLDQGRLCINPDGPRMGAANIRKFSDRMVSSIASSDMLVMKGCRIHEMLQGGLGIPTFSAYVVTRTLSEQVSGFDSSNHPVLFFHLAPGEYSFWGINKKDSKTAFFASGKQVCSTHCTTHEHTCIKHETDLRRIVDKFNSLYSKVINYSGYSRPLFQEMNVLSEKIIDITRLSYENNAVRYDELRQGKQGALTLMSWDILSRHIEEYLDASNADIKLLDVGAAGGQGILRAQEYGYHAYGLDISERFVTLLTDNTKILNRDKDHIRKCDSRFIDFGSGMFDVVRQSASLLHIPLIAKGYSCDLALAESNRVLKEGGLLFISVKKGNGIELQDTGEGLGVRAFQLFTVDQMVAMLQRNGFEPVFFQEFFEQRNAYETRWLIFIAQKIVSHEKKGKLTITTATEA